MAASQLYEIARAASPPCEREDFRNDFIAMLMRKQRYLAERFVT
jgi:hypothetical protein